MNGKRTISLMHACFLIPASSYGGIVYLHSEVFRITQRQAWIAEFLGGLSLIPFAIWILYIFGKYPQKTIFEIIEINTGKLLARFFSVLYIGIMLVLSALALRQFCAMILNYFLHTTPIILIMAMTLLVSFFIASDGIENLARTNLIMVLIAYPVFYVGQLIGLFKKFEWANIFPIWEKDFQSFINASYLSTGLLSEMLLFLLIMAAYIHNPQKSYKGILVAMIVFEVFVPSTVVLITQAVLGPEEAGHVAFAGINVAQTISMGRFIQGMEYFVITTYQVIILAKLAINLFSAWNAFTFTLNSRKPSKLVLGFIAASVLILCIYTVSYNQANIYYIFMGRYVLIPFIFLILLFTSFSILQKKRRNIDS